MLTSRGDRKYSGKSDSISICIPILFAAALYKRLFALHSKQLHNRWRALLHQALNAFRHLGANIKPMLQAICLKRYFVFIFFFIGIVGAKTFNVLAIAWGAVVGYHHTKTSIVG